MKQFAQLFVFCAAITIMPTAAMPAQTSSTIGSFYVTVDKDPFDESATVVAMAIGGGGVFALRCIQETLTVAVALQSRVEEGGAFLIKLRADNKTVFEEKGLAVGDKIIEVDDEIDKIFDEVSGAKSVSVRVTGASTFTFTVPVWQSAKVVEQVRKACAAKSK